MRLISTLSLILVSIIHLLPLVGVLSIDKLNMLYGLKIDDPNLEILLRHRAVLFGLLGLFLLYAAFKQYLHLIAFIATFVSILSFICLCWLVPSYNEELLRILRVDIVALVIAATGLFAHFLNRKKSTT